MTMRCMRLAIGSLALCVAASATAQSSLQKGKTGAQLYASVCADCHKSPQSVTTAPGIFGLESFLQEHYTTSHESAAAIAAYLSGLKKPVAASPRGRPAKDAGQAKPVAATPSQSQDGVPRPPADIKRGKSN